MRAMAGRVDIMLVVEGGVAVGGSPGMVGEMAVYLHQPSEYEW